MMNVLNIHQKKCDLTGFINSESDPSPHCFMFLPTWAGWCCDSVTLQALSPHLSLGSGPGQMIF